MDACEIDQVSKAPKLLLDAAERNDGTSDVPHVRELRVRAKSHTPTCFPSSNTSGTSTLSVPTQKRAESVEKRRPTMSGLSTSFHGTSVDMELATGKVNDSKLTDSLWPSRMCTQSAHFWSQEAVSDHTLKPSLNVAYKQTVMPPASVKATRERMRTILKGKNVNDQLQNLKPLDGSHVRLVDQHRWPSTTGSNVLSKNINLPSDVVRLSSDNGELKNDKLQSISTTLANPSRLEFDELQRISYLVSSSSSQKTALVTPKVRSHSSTTESEPSSPNKSYGLDSKGVSPSRAMALIPAPAKRVSPFPAATRVNPSPAASRGVSLFPAAIGVTLSPITSRGVSPSPASKGVKPSPTATGVNPSPVTTEVKPSHAASRGVSPLPSATEVSLSPADIGVSPSIAVTTVNPCPAVSIATGASLAPSRGVNPSIAATSVITTPSKGVGLAPSKGVNHTSTATGVGPAPSRVAIPTPTATVVSPAPYREVSPAPATTWVDHPAPSIRVSGTLVSTGAGPAPFRGANPPPVAKGDDPTPSKGTNLIPATTRVNTSLVAIGVGPSITAKEIDPTPTKEVGLNPATKGIGPSLATKEINPTSATRKIDSTPVREVGAPPAREVDATPVRGVSPTPAARGLSPTPATRGANPSPADRGVSSAPTNRGASPTPVARGAKPTPTTRGANLAPLRGIGHFISSMGASLTSVVRGANPAPSTKGVSPTPAADGTTVSPTRDAKAVSHTRDARAISPTEDARAISPTHNARAVSPTHMRPSSPRKSCNSNKIFVSTEIGPPVRDVGPTASGVGLSPAKGVSPSPFARESNLASSRGTNLILSVREVSPPHSIKGVSPTPSAREVSPPRATRGASPTPINPSSSRHSNNSSTISILAGIGHLAKGVGARAKGVGLTPIWPSIPKQSSKSNMVSAFTEIVDAKKGKKLPYDIDDALYLELLYNIRMQWQFLNASTEAALDLQKATAEESLFNSSRTNSKLQDSIAAKKIYIDVLIMQLKLYVVLNRQMPYIDEWASIQTEHEAALSDITKDLHASTHRLPITEGAKVDIKNLKKAVYSTLQVMLTMVSSIKSMLSKVEGTHRLASELATIVSHERALLDECEILLASVDPLRVEEYSLRTYLIQSKQACKSE